MATQLKRFTISVTPEMEEKLEKVKRELYYKETQNYMVRELISLGLKTLEKERENE